MKPSKASRQLVRKLKHELIIVRAIVPDGATDVAAAIDEDKRDLVEALAWALDYGGFGPDGVGADNPLSARALDNARAALARHREER